MIYYIGICVALSALFETLSYMSQIRKIRNGHKSKDVSSSAYFDKIIKYVFGTAALILSKNWVGLCLELIAFTLCIITTYYVVAYKPKDWSWRNVKKRN